jgi:hypothetical protein
MDRAQSIFTFAFIALLSTTLSTIGKDSFAASNSEKAQKKTAFGAIAWHPETGRFGYSYDFQTERAANVAALKECGHERCEIAVSIKNGCAALAQGAKGYAAKKGNTREEAETIALRACGKDCRPLAWACTR